MINHLIAIANLPRKQKGLTTVEYAVAGGILVALIAAAFILLGGGIGDTVDTIIGCMDGAC